MLYHVHRLRTILRFVTLHLHLLEKHLLERNRLEYIVVEYQDLAGFLNDSTHHRRKILIRLRDIQITVSLSFH